MYLVQIFLEVGLGSDHLLDPNPEGFINGLSLFVEIVGGLVHGMLVQFPLSA